MKRNNIFFGLIVVTIAVIVGMATLNNSKVNTNSNIHLLTKGDAPRLNNGDNNYDENLMDGPDYKFATREGINSSKQRQPEYTPNFNLGSGRSHDLLGNSNAAERVGKRSNGSISISGGNINLGGQNGKRTGNDQLMAITAVGRSNFGSNAQLNLEPFVETGPTSRVDGNVNPGDPVPAGEPLIPLMLFATAWIVFAVKRK